MSSLNNTTTAVTSRPLTEDEIAAFTKKVARAMKVRPTEQVDATTDCRPGFFPDGDEGFLHWWENHGDPRPEAIAAIMDGDCLVGVQVTFVAWEDQGGGFIVPSEYKVGIEPTRTSLVWNFANNWGRRTATIEVANALSDIGL